MTVKFDPVSTGERAPAVPLGDAMGSPFELRAGAYEASALTLLSLRGREQISQPFSFELTVAASADVDDATIESDLLGRRACLMMRAGASGSRFVRGVVASVAAHSAVHGRRAIYRLRLVPALWLLKKRTTSRIFQDKTVPEIVTAVLDEAAVPHVLRLLGQHRPRTYCVQYRETDLEFVERLLAEEGIFYTFDHGGPDAEAEIVSFGDSAHVYPQIQGDAELVYRPHGGAGKALSEHHLERFDRRRSLRPTSVLRWGYDFRNPAQTLTAEAKLEDPTRGEPARGEAFVHHEEDEEPNVLAGAVNAELAQLRARVEVGRGASGCRRLVPGSWFKVCDHDLGRLDGEYVVTQIKHEGHSPESATEGQAVYVNTFECVSKDVAARPQRPARALQQVTETALVVGPDGQEIHTDEHGRIKVQFHWDRAGKRNEHSSCWIRVSQAWAGSGWGFQFIPRVGMEVVVTFLGGDVDRPLITGCVPNAVNQPPFLLPKSKTQSGIRTNSTPGGLGHNELRFEDQKGAEQISLRAERDLDEMIRNNHTVHVAVDETITVGQNRGVDVLGNLRERTDGTRYELVGESSAEEVGSSKTVIVHGAESRTVKAGRSTVIEGNDSLSVSGNHTIVVGTDDKPRSYDVYAGADHVTGSGQSIRLTAEESIVLTCGESTLVLTKDAIRMHAPTIELVASKSLQLQGNGPAIKLGDNAEILANTIRLFAKSSNLLLEERDAHLNGKKVLLNCSGLDPSASTGKGVKVETKPLSLKLTDDQFQPYASKEYIVMVSGIRFEGTTGADGTVKHDVPKDAQVAMLMLWVGERPTGKTLRFQIQLEDLPDVTTPLGAQKRLVNLGYLWVPPSGELDALTQDALRAFQEDHGLDGTGELDGPTQGKLVEVQGH